MRRAEERLYLGPAAVVSVSRAAELLPIKDSDARSLIERTGIVRRLGGKRVVLWADCIALAELEEQGPVLNAPSRKLRRL